MNVPSININKVCLSGLNSIYLANQMIMSGEADIVIAGGMESMTNAPYLAQGARGGFRYGNTELQDAIIKDGLWCAFDACLMGLGTERYAAGGITREQQDDLAMKSNVRAAAAIADGRLADEIVAGRSSRSARATRPSSPPTRACAANTTMESLGGLKPAFDKEGTITAANASQISDGGSAIVMMSEKAVERSRRHAAGPVRVVRHGRRPGQRVVAAPAQPRHPCGRSSGPARPSPTSTCSRSTRRSPPSASPRWPSWASATRSSTSTAAPSPSATRSA